MPFLTSATLSPARYAAEALYVALGDEPGQPPGCLKIILACVDVLRENVHALSALCRSEKLAAAYDYHLANEDHTPRLYPEVFQRIMAFLTEPWSFSSDEEFAALGRRLWLCRCRAVPLARVCHERRFNELHDSIPIMSPINALGDLVTSMAELVTAATELTHARGSVYKVRRNLKRAERRGTALAFPATPLDLLPRGSSATMDAICTWLPLDSGARIMSLIHTIVNVCRGEVLSPFVNCRILQEDIKATAKRAAYLIQASGTLPHDDPISLDLISVAHLLGLIYTFVPRSEMAAFATVSNVIETAESCLHVLSAIGGLKSPQMLYHMAIVCRRRFGAQMPPGLNLAADGALDADDGNVDSVLYSEVEALLLVYDYFLTFGALAGADTDQGSRPSTISQQAWENAIASVHQRAQQFTSVDTYDSVLKMLDMFVASQRCGSPDCLNTFASEGRPFSRCSGCLQIPYCSLECQRRAYRHHQLPHRALCRYMRAVHQVKLAEVPCHSSASLSAKRLNLLHAHLEQLSMRH